MVKLLHAVALKAFAWHSWFPFSTIGYSEAASEDGVRQHQGSLGCVNGIDCVTQSEHWKKVQEESIFFMRWGVLYYLGTTMPNWRFMEREYIQGSFTCYRLVDSYSIQQRQLVSLIIFMLAVVAQMAEKPYQLQQMLPQ